MVLQLETKMGTDTAYTVKVGDLSRRFDLGAMDLVRICGIAVNTAYQAIKNENINLDSCYKIYRGLKDAGYDVVFTDIVEID